jgi:signal transduction histidine kinase
MTESEPATPARGDALLGAALVLVEEGATSPELAARFAEAGAVVARDRAAALLDRLAALGLVAVATGEEPRYVPTTLGRGQRAGLLEGAPAVADRLAELEQLRGDLLAAVAHERRTPLTAVRTSIGLLLDSGVEPDAAARARLLRNIAHGADRMQQLVTDVLDLARFRTARVRLQSRRFDARQVAEDAAAALAPLFESRRQRLDLRLPRRPVWVYADRRRVEQVLLNLLSNAHTFSADGARAAHGRHEGAERFLDGRRRWAGHRAGGPGAAVRALLHDRRPGRARRRLGARPAHLPRDRARARRRDRRRERAGPR